MNIEIKLSKMIADKTVEITLTAKETEIAVWDETMHLSSLISMTSFEVSELQRLLEEAQIVARELQAVAK